MEKTDDSTKLCNLRCRLEEEHLDDISLEFFYKPHTTTIFATTLAAIAYISLTRYDDNQHSNIQQGLYLTLCCFIVISLLAFPSGPFIRPHPAIWRIVFGASVLYLMVLVFSLFQNYQTIMEMLQFISSDLNKNYTDIEGEHDDNCSLTLENIWAHLDVYILAHFIGFILKAVLIRNLSILLAASILWELTEIIFNRLIPIFKECWWDTLILDISICNLFGMLIGLKICQILEIREYKWVYFRDIPSVTHKLRRAVLQFTPARWTKLQWMDPSLTYIRFFAISLLVIFWLTIELNTFFLKAIFNIPTTHFLVISRLILITFITAPSVKQYYGFISDKECKRLGSQCWVCGAIVIVEALLCMKNGKEIFDKTLATNIICWLGGILVLTCIIVYGCVLWNKYCETKDDLSRESSPRKPPLPNLQNSRPSVANTIRSDSEASVDYEAKLRALSLHSVTLQ